MKAMILLATFLGFAVLVPQQQKKQEDFGLPELHKINTITLSPTYGCRSVEDFHKGYESTALFLSDYSRRSNAPELLFNGVCKGKDSLQSATAGDDIGLIADLGETPIEKLTAQLMFNVRNVDSFDLYSKFTRSVPVQLNHTYAVVIDHSGVRALFVFTITGYIPNQKLDLMYAVKDYQVLQRRAESPGFSWDREND